MARPRLPHGGAGPLVCAALLACLLSLLFSCSQTQPQKGGADSPLPLLVTPGPDFEPEGGRVSPVYEQWLLRQSMLGEARELTSSLAASPRLWRRSAALQDKELLRRAAPTWIRVKSRKGDVGSAPLEARLSSLAEFGVRGVFLEDALEGDAAWRPEPAQGQGGPASLRLNSSLRDKERFQGLLKAAEERGVQMGMAMAPAATGFGPDFMLQARGSASHRGMYLLLELPERLWNILPEAKGSWDCRPLAPEVRQILHREGVLPGALRQDGFQASKTVWAATGKVLGVDGKARRLVYRALGSPWRPVLCWQDPAGAARMTLAGSALKSAGILRQTLTGVSLEGLWGLDPSPSSGQTLDELTPGQAALEETAQLLRRCGGWSLLLDELTLAQAESLRGRCDFLCAPGFSEGLEKAMASGDASNLAQSLRILAGSRLDLKDLAFSAPPAHPAKDLNGGADKGNQGSSSEARLSAALPLGLPGLCMLDEASLSGASLSGASLSGAPSLRAAGRPDPPALLRDALRARAELGLSSGRLERVLQPQKGLLVVLSALPGGGFFLTALNFSYTSVQHEVTLPAGASRLSALSLTPDARDPARTSATSLSLSLDARQAVHLLLK